MMVLMGCSKSDDPNMAPNQPSNLLPVNGETCESLKPTFSWDATDPEDDELIYTFWLGTSEDKLDIVVDNLKNSSYTPAQKLALSTKYYWQVEASDGISSTKSEIITFGTKGEGESGVMPSRPLIIAPKSNQMAGDITFSWNAATDGIGEITYDLYIRQGTATSFSLLKGALVKTSYTSNIATGNLMWYVEAKDGRGQKSRSETVIITLN
jgi:hypothetical protein